MPRKTTPSFITTIPLIVTSRDEKELNARFNAGMRLYNACLNEAMTRMDLVRASETFKAAKKIPRTIPGKDGKPINNPARTLAFNKARQAYRFSEFELHAFATLTAKNSNWIAQKIDSNTQQKIATRAFKAAERVLLGKAKKVRFKVPARFRSMEGKSNKTGIRWKDEQLVWGKLQLKPLLDSNDPVILHGLNSPIKLVRILRKELRGKTRWYVQLINEGQPYQKPKNTIGSELVGIDLNISNLAVVGDIQAELMPFAEGVPDYQKEVASLQRSMQRSQRVSNPDNYEPDFYTKKGRKTLKKKGMPKKGNKGLKKGQRREWKKSKRYQKLAQRKRELERRKAAYAKSQNQRLVNDVLRIGKHVKAEKVSIKGWQKRYGKAIAAKSPGFVQSELKRKAENAGGKFETFSTQTTALSQTHLDGSRHKKSLSQRIHYDVTGIVMHRDLFSAYLARYVNEDQLDADTAREQYAGLEPVLVGASKRYELTLRPNAQAQGRRVKESASTPACRRSGVKPSEQIPRKGKSSSQIANSNRNSGEKLESSLSVSPVLEEPPG